jgi:hypothetical protein
MKAMAVGYLVRRAGLCLVLATCATRAQGQNCQALLQQIISGGADVQWAMAAQQEYNNNCLGQRQQQPRSPPPTYNQTPTYNPQPNGAATQKIPNKISQEWTKLGEMLMKGQPLRQDIPLSAGLKMMETVAAPPPAPTGYVDPFAARTFPAITRSTSGPVRPGSIWDPSQMVSLSPPAAPSATSQKASPSSGPCGPYGTLCNAPITGFDRPAVVTPLRQSR